MMLKEVWIIALDEFVQSLKSRKAQLMIASYIALVFIGIKVSGFLEIFAIFSGFQQRLYFTQKALFMVSLILLSLFSIFIGYTLISGETHKKSMRFIASRVRRSSIILGKFFGALMLSSLMIFLVYVFGTIMILYKIKELFILNAFVLWIFLSLFSAVFLSVSTLVSSLTKEPDSSLKLLVFILAFFFVADYTKLFNWLTPIGYYNFGLSYIDSAGAEILTAMIIFLVFTIVYLSASVIAFNRRDL